MNIQGSRERILDSVLPHEVTHTIFASYFRQPVPRWADEGACTTMEHRSEVAKQERNLIEYLRNGRGIPFSQMLVMKEYPHDVMPLYSQGHSLVSFLVGQGGRQKFLNYIAAGMEQENWADATRQFYSYSSLGELQNQWLTWVRQGSPTQPAGAAATQVASNSEPAAPATLRPRTDGDLRAGAGGEVQVIAAAPLVPLAGSEATDGRWRRAGAKNVSQPIGQSATSEASVNQSASSNADSQANTAVRAGATDASGQVILEWSRTAPNAPAAPSAAAGSVANSMERPSVYDARANPGSATRRF
jgi:hypothetical protein